MTWLRVAINELRTETFTVNGLSISTCNTDFREKLTAIACNGSAVTLQNIATIKAPKYV